MPPAIYYRGVCREKDLEFLLLSPSLSLSLSLSDAFRGHTFSRGAVRSSSLAYPFDRRRRRRSAAVVSQDSARRVVTSPSSDSCAQQPHTRVTKTPRTRLRQYYVSSCRVSALRAPYIMTLYAPYTVRSAAAAVVRATQY